MKIPFIKYNMKQIFRILSGILYLLPVVTAYSKDHPLKKEQIIEDIVYLDSMIRTVHPDPFYYTSSDTYHSLKDNILANLQDSLSVEKAYLTVAPLLASLRDGHSMMLIPYDPLVSYLKAGGKIFPIDIYMNHDKLFVRYDCHTQLKFDDDTEILAINNINISDLLSAIYKLYPVEVYKNLFYKSIERDFYLLLLYMESLKTENIQLKLRQDEQLISYDTRLIPYAVYTSYQKGQSIPANYLYTLTANESIAEIKIGSFMPTPAYYQFIDSVFSDLQNHPIKNMIIDIRGNSGGSSAAVDSLLCYLYPDSFRIYSEAYLKISEDVKKKYQSKNETQYARIKDKKPGEIIPERMSGTISNKSDIYTGPLKILADEATYSGAASFANLITQVGRGDVSGRVGSHTTYFGDFLFFTLPNTGFTFTISTKKFINYTSKLEKRNT